VKLVTWNVNPLEARLPRVREFLTEHAPRRHPTQETKTEDAAFPAAELASAGYHPVGRWADVAIAARDGLALEAPVAGLPGELRDDEARWIEAPVGGVRVMFLDVAGGRVAALRAQGAPLAAALTTP
jgi:exodeoxyribonuclease-3